MELIDHLRYYQAACPDKQISGQGITQGQGSCPYCYRGDQWGDGWGDLEEESGEDGWENEEISLRVQTWLQVSTNTITNWVLGIQHEYTGLPG